MARSSVAQHTALSAKGFGATGRWLFMAVLLCLLTGPGAAQVESVFSVQPGRLFVEFANRDVTVIQGKTGLTVFDRAAERYGVQSIVKFFPFLDVIARKRTLTPAMESLRYIYSVEYSAPQLPEVVARELARDPAVILAEPQPVHRVTGLTSENPNDPRFFSQGHLSHLRLPEAWDVAKGGQSGVVIAIIDSGVHWEHDDLRENIWTNPNEVPGNGIDDDNNGFIDDIHGWNFRTRKPDVYGDGTHATHGTVVAGIAGAVTNNALGIAGAGWNAQIMPINTTCEDGENLCHTLDGVVYAAVMGADIVNCSFGSDKFSEVALRVYQAAFAEGALAVAAAGNERVNVDVKPHYPSGFAVTLSVGGTARTSDGNRFNYGRSVNVFAPGVGIHATLPRNRYGTSSGTSVAAPLISAVAALVRTAFPDYTPGQIREQVRLTAHNIDAVQFVGNPGEFGRGRVDAFRAVTETAGPALRLTAVEFTNQNGSQEASTGDIVTVRAQFTNYLGDASGATVALRTGAAFVEFIKEEVTGVSLAYGDSVTYEFSFKLTDTAPDNHSLLFYSEIRQGSLTDTPDLFRIPINQTLVTTHYTSAMRLSITREGNIGYTGFQGDPMGQGVGFRVQDATGNERDPLFEAGLLVATGPTMVSNSVRGVASPDQDDHFAIPEGESMQIAIPGPITSQEGRLVLTDQKASTPIGVRILQQSYVDHGDGNEDFAIFKYTVGNEAAHPITNLHIGLFFDWDIDQEDVSRDQAGFSGAHSSGWGADQSGSLHVGLRLLTDPHLINYRAIDNRSEIYNGFTFAEKWQAMSRGLSQAELTDTEMSQLMASGPHSVPSGETIEVAFALIAGASAEDFLNNADQAKEVWDHVINAPPTMAVQPEERPGWTIDAMYPNPTRGEVTIRYGAPLHGTATIEIFDVLGRRVATLTERRPSARSTTWDARQEDGRVLPPGVYLVRLTGKARDKTHLHARPLVVVR